MGFHKKSKRKRGNDKEKKDPRGEGETRGEGYKDIVKENESFENYYQAQKIVPEGEWDQFMAALREGLPAAFRITGYRGQAKALLQIIKSQYFSELVKMHLTGEDGKKISDPFPLPWYPEELAWQMKLSRVTIRKSEHLSQLHQFLMSETESGNISRQETVSMIPPILLGVQPHHKVLDMCASPGSKSAQIIEMLHKEGDKIPQGFLVANDVDNRRCYMLVHQAKRLHTPCFVITNHDATQMPMFSVGSETGEQTPLLYDRILCDVPCSGDGTIRKNIDVWRKWNVGNGNNLHSLQVLLVKRGLELLAQHGRLVYSTCSLNPIENEAVMATILQMAGGTVRLVDARDQLPGLKTCPGLTHWRVMTRDMKEFPSWNDVPERFVTQIRPGMFPPSQEVAQEIHLDRCLRILPHHQDTGGFFVAVLEKHESELPWQKKNKDASSSEQAQDGSPPPKKKRKFWGHKEDPFLFMAKDDPIWPDIRDSYKLTPDFPYQQLLSRNVEGRKRNMYFVSEAVKDIVALNSEKVKIINTGVRLLCRNDCKDPSCEFRITQEGLPTMLPFYKGKVMELHIEDMDVILNNEYPTIEQFKPETQEALSDYDSGCTIISHVANKGMDSEVQIHLCGWKGHKSLRCYVSRADRVHYLRICRIPSRIVLGEKKGNNGNKQQPPLDNTEGNLQPNLKEDPSLEETQDLREDCLQEDQE